jgi:hypothetical protein
MSRILIYGYKYKDKIKYRYMTNYIDFCIGYSKKYDIKKGRDVTNKYHECLAKSYMDCLYDLKDSNERDIECNEIINEFGKAKQ